MESGDCGNGNNVQFSSAFDQNSEQLPKTQPHEETEDISCEISLKHEKLPRRIIHFSDGTIEEYSSEEDEPDASTQVTTANPSTLRWGPWIWYHTVNVGIKSLQVCDYLGEHLASFFGITSPKYQFEIDEYDRMMAEEEERNKKQDLEMGGWTETKDTVQSTPLQQTNMMHPAVQGDTEMAEEERKKKQNLEMGGWTETKDTVQSTPLQQTNMMHPAVQGDTEMAVNRF